MTIYIPRVYAEWLETKPEEGRIMIIALLAKLAYIYGTDCYLQLYNDDLDTINLTSPPGRNVSEIKDMVKLGLLDQINGLTMKCTIKLSDHYTRGQSRVTILKDTCAVQLSQEASLIWSYLMGRLANVDANKDIELVSKIRLYESTQSIQKWKGADKTSVSHILPPIYQDSFKKEVGNIYTSVKIESDLIKGKAPKAYHKEWYESNREVVLKRKAEYYKNKKKHDDKNGTV